MENENGYPERPASAEPAASVAEHAATAAANGPAPADAAARHKAPASAAAPAASTAYVASSEAYFAPDSKFPQPGSVRYEAAPAAAPAPAPARAPKKRHGWIVAIVVVLCLCIVTVFSISSCTSLVGSTLYTSSSQATAPNSIGIIEITSTIQYDWTANSPEGLKYLLDEAADDSNIKAVVLRVDSGGGTATAGEEMATYVREFREMTGKPVVVSSASLNCSAAYEISSQADCIYVAKTTEIGAIGTVMQTYDTSELLDKLGINVYNIASSDSKDSTYGTRPLTDEEIAYYQALVNEINDAFVENVANGRHLTLDEARALANGLPYAGTTAVTNGLADKIGTLEDAVDEAAALAGIGSSYQSFYLGFESSELSSLISLLGQSNSSGLSTSEIAEVLKEYSYVKPAN